MACAEKQRLRNEYSIALKILCEAMRVLQTKTGANLTKALAASSTSARARCAKAGDALVEHKANHGC
jgi:hypothetical protein